MLDLLRAKVEQGPMMQSAHEQVIQHLALMRRHQRLRGLDLYDNTSIYQEIGEILFAERIKG